MKTKGREGEREREREREKHVASLKVWGMLGAREMANARHQAIANTTPF